MLCKIGVGRWPFTIQYWPSYITVTTTVLSMTDIEQLANVGQTTNAYTIRYSVTYSVALHIYTFLSDTCVVEKP